MRSVRSLALAVVLALVVAACGSELVPDDLPLATGEPTPSASGPASGDPADGTEAADDPDAGDGSGGTDGDDGGTDTGDDQGASDGDGGGNGAGTEAEPQPNLTSVQDDGPVGANAAAYLRGDRPRVVLEIDVQDGARFGDGVVAHVRDVLARESNATVEVQLGAATSTRRDAWTPDQLRAAADETRSVAHSDDTAVLHLLVLRDQYEDEGVLGLAFGSSSAVVFPDRWSDLTTALLSGDRIARAVSTHEVGHLLGLVGLFEEPVNDHEDPEHPGHTTDRNDVMYYAVERSIISQLDGIPTDFGELTRADLAAIREG